MSDWYNSVWWPNLKQVIVGAWPEVDTKLFQDTSVERRDWYNELNEGALTAPWCVVSLDVQPTGEWAACPTWEIKASIYYITSLALAKQLGVTVTSMITAKLVLLQEALYRAQTVGSVDDAITYDINAENPINASFLQAKIDYQAGAVEASFIVAVIAV